jgi:hypothetical protein
MTHSMSIKPALQVFGSVPTGSGLCNCEDNHLRFGAMDLQNPQDIAPLTVSRLSSFPVPLQLMTKHYRFVIFRSSSR